MTMRRSDMDAISNAGDWSQRSDGIDGALVISAAAVPVDALFAQQWHLLNTGQTGGRIGVDINVVDVWTDYAGAGVVVGVVDDGVQHSHQDLDGNYDTGRDYDAVDRDGNATPSALGGSQQAHGTAVAGLIAAENNGSGVVGVAYEATLVGYRMSYSGSGPARQEIDLLSRQFEVDVSNNSWTFTSLFADSFLRTYFQAHHSALADAVTWGRGGLGTVVVFAAGNSREDGDNVNAHNLQNARETIAVAAINHNGEPAYYSTPGAAILVGAPSSGDGQGITTTDLVGSGNGYAGSSDTTGLFGGTSAATPIVSGVVALMLEANPGLGYRDVQEILAYSARQISPFAATVTENGAVDWNGGGLLASHDVGFGLIDAHAAVRMAETWTAQSTRANEAMIEVASAPMAAIPDGGSVSDSIYLSSGIRIDHVEVELHVAHGYIGDLVVSLTSPDGTTSVLIDRPGKDPDDATDFGLFRSDIDFILTSTHHWGETGDGLWTLTVADEAEVFSGTLESWSLTLYGDVATDDDTYIFTDQFGTVASADVSRRTLSDERGIDTLNAAAVTSALDVDLTPSAISSISGGTLAITAATTIEHAIGGDGNDRIGGNDAANRLQGARGDDRLAGGAGDDTLIGGTGRDTLNGQSGADTYVFRAGDGIDRVGEAATGSGDTAIDRLILADVTTIDDVGISTAGSYLRLGLPDDDAIWVIRFFDAAGFRIEALELADGTSFGIPHGTTGSAADDILLGGSADELLAGGAGNDFLIGGPGRDGLNGNAGADTYLFRSGDGVDRIGEAGGDTAETVIDRIRLPDIHSVSEVDFGISGSYLRLGLPGGDAIWVIRFFDDPTLRVEQIELAGGGVYHVPHGTSGSAADDVVLGTPEGDYLRGFEGDDVLVGGAGVDTLLGNAGNDRYVFHTGSGVDRIGESGGLDTLVLADVQDIGQVRFGFAGDYLRLNLTGDDALWLVRFFASPDYQVEAIELGDGSSFRLATDLVGTGVDEVLLGTEASELILGEAGNDVLVGGTGSDTLRGGTGDDRLHWIAGADIDGGDGFDELVIQDDDALIDFSLLPSAGVRNIEAIDLRLSESALLSIAQDSVFAFTDDRNSLRIDGGTDDRLEVDAGWSPDGFELFGADSYTVYAQGGATLVVSDEISVSAAT